MYEYSRRSPYRAMNSSRSAVVRARQCGPRLRAEISVKSKSSPATCRIIRRRSAVRASFFSSESETTFRTVSMESRTWSVSGPAMALRGTMNPSTATTDTHKTRSEEHTSELQSQSNLVCRLLLEKKKKTHTDAIPIRYHIEHTQMLSQ